VEQVKAMEEAVVPHRWGRSWLKIHIPPIPPLYHPRVKGYATHFFFSGIRIPNVDVTIPYCRLLISLALIALESFLAHSSDEIVGHVPVLVTSLQYRFVVVNLRKCRLVYQGVQKQCRHDSGS